MATYVPNASTLTEPTASRTVASAAEEFRVLKTSLDTRADLLDADLTVAEAAIDALEVDVAELQTQMAGIAAGTDSTALAANLASTASGKGAALVGVQDAAGDWSGLNQEEVNAEIGFLLIRSGDRLNALSAFSDSEQAAIMAKTSTTDHQAQISDLLGNNRHVHFPRGRYNGSAAITITNTLHISGDPFAELRFTDGAYTALSFTSGSAARSKIENIFIRGTASAAPTVTLVRMDTAAGYSTISGCWFAYADLCLDLDGVYITSVYDNIFAVAKRYWRLEDSTFGTAANQFWGNKYGTPIAGNIADLIYIAAPGVTMFGEYWETQQHGCTALHLATGAVRAEVMGKLEVCGDIVIDTSVEAHLQVNMDNCWKTTSNWAVRVNGGANAYIGNSSIRLSALDAALTGISAAGGAAVSATDVRNFGSGVVLSSVGGVRGSQIRGCSTGVTFTSGSTAVLGVDNTFISNTTNVVNNSGGSAIAPGSFTATLTGCTTSPAGGARYEVDNGIVALTVPGLTGTSNTTDCTLTGLPAAIQPVGAVFGTVALVLDNGVRSSEQCSISGGTLTLYRNDSATGFTASGTKGTRACVVTYRLRNV